MENTPPAYPNPQKAPVKMIKVPVKRPVGAPPVRMIKVPAGAKPNPQGGAPVRMVKMPVPPAPARVAQPPASSVSLSQTAPEPVQRPAVVPSAYEQESVAEQETFGKTNFPNKMPLPKNIVRAVAKLKYPEQKMVAFSLYLRMWAESLAQEGRFQMPSLLFPVPKTTEELENFQLKHEDVLTMLQKDAFTLVSCFPRLKQIHESTVPVADLLERENGKLEQKRKLSREEQFGMALLLVKIDFEIFLKKEEEKEIREFQRKGIDFIQQTEKRQKKLQNRFIKEIQKKGFPVDAEKLVKNYLTFAKKEPEKAYTLLTTNPFYFSPILMEKKTAKGTVPVKIKPEEAKDINKKLAAFLKKMKA